MSVKRAKLEEAQKELESELWPALEAEFGELISRPFRELMREQVIIQDLEDCLNNMDGDPEGKEGLIESCKRSITERWQAAKVYAYSKFGQPTGTAPPKPRKVYRKCFERRLHLLDFVMEQKGGIGARANWEAITAAWNKAHPFDTMNLPILKAEFYQAKKDKAVTTNYIAIIMEPIAHAFQKLAEQWGKIDSSTLEKHGIKNLNDLVRMEDMGMTLDNLLKAQEKGQLSEYIKDMIENSGYKKEVNQ